MRLKKSRMIITLHSFRNFDGGFSENEDDWYHESDTAEEISDPNLVSRALFQAKGKMPCSLEKSHFLEGCICTYTKYEES